MHGNNVAAATNSCYMLYGHNFLCAFCPLFCLTVITTLYSFVLSSLTFRDVIELIQGIELMTKMADLGFQFMSVYFSFCDTLLQKRQSIMSPETVMSDYVLWTVKCLLRH